MFNPELTDQSHGSFLRRTSSGLTLTLLGRVPMRDRLPTGFRVTKKHGVVSIDEFFGYARMGFRMVQRMDGLKTSRDVVSPDLLIKHTSPRTQPSYERVLQKQVAQIIEGFERELIHANQKPYLATFYHVLITLGELAQHGHVSMADINIPFVEIYGRSATKPSYWTFPNTPENLWWTMQNVRQAAVAAITQELDLNRDDRLFTALHFFGFARRVSNQTFIEDPNDQKITVAYLPKPRISTN